MTSRILVALLLLLGGGTGRGVAQVVPSAELGRVRELYLAAVRDERSIAPALAEVEAVERRAPALAPHLAAYRGALVTLRAKHARWPQAKLRHLRAGLATLDSVVAHHPDLAEPRYLRLMSCYYLPRFFGRGATVRDDFAALARLLPRVRPHYPPELYRAITRFVLQKGGLGRPDRDVLEATVSDG